MPLSELHPRTPLLDGHDAEALRSEIRQYYLATWQRYESLFGALACDEAYYEKSIPLRHPLIFYLGHTATFFVNKLVLAGLMEQRIDPKLESMFAIGVDEMSWDDLNDDHYDWPAIDEVWAYRAKVRAQVEAIIDRAPLHLPISWQNPWWAILMGIEHELIHLETSSVLIRQHKLEYVQPCAGFEPCHEHGAAPENTLLEVPAGHVVLGRDDDDPFYGWDNEYGRHKADVPAFAASKYLVTNAEYLVFVEAGGYAEDRYWDEEGLGWRTFSKAEFPTFWVPNEVQWKLRLMSEEVAMPWDWPVETNCHEARAFCRWKAEQTGQPIRLPTEDEWHRLYQHVGLEDVPGDVAAKANLHLDHFASSCPVTRFAHGEFYDVVGNVWQWTETPTWPYEGFKVHPIYDDFTTPTFDNQHNMIKGGSWISLGNESRHVSRYAFRRHFFQHAGFRYIASEAPVNIVTTGYETDLMLSQYADMHYGENYFGVPNFPKALAEIAIELHGSRPAKRALDLGCATGRAVFELARHFEHVTGVDFSARFINAGVRLADQGVLRYTMPDEGDLVTYHEASLTGLGLDDVRDRVEFWQGDACNLKDTLTGYDLILAANLIDRLYSPKRLLDSIHQRLNPGGLLLIASPYTWLEEHTKREEWLGGYKRDGESWFTLDGLREALAPHFEQVGEPREVPFVIRETKRKFQHSISELTAWRLRD